MGLFDEDTPRWVRLSILGMVAALVGLVAVIVLLVVGLDGDDNDSAGEPASPGGSDAADGGSTSVCGLPDGDQSIPTAAPAADWEVVNGIAIPSSPEYGPGLVKDAGGKDRSCFAHSPLGAVFFVMNAPANLGVDSSGAEYVGFRVLSYRGDTASVEYAARGTEGPDEGLLFAAPFELTWANGDWSLGPGADDVKPIVLSSLNGYVQFASGETP